jgi:hypothetical protein
VQGHVEQEHLEGTLLLNLHAATQAVQLLFSVVYIGGQPCSLLPLCMCVHALSKPAFAHNMCDRFRLLGEALCCTGEPQPQ